MGLETLREHAEQRLPQPGGAQRVSLEKAREYLEKQQRAGAPEILSDLGIVGWGRYERAVEVFSLLGGSILLVGSHGEAKSLLAKRLAQAFGVASAVYDAAKSTWEDIMGFPDPAKLMDLEKRGDAIGFPRIETPTSVWGKRLALVDEINRALPEMQSKWFEVILNQTLMGEPTGLKWILSAMNPGYAATFPLDQALVSRYMLFIQAPKAVRMRNEDIAKILGQDNPDEVPAFPTWEIREAVRDDIVIQDGDPSVPSSRNPDFLRGSRRLKATMWLAADAMPEIRKRYGSAVSEYVTSVVKSLADKAKFDTDGRRMRMMQNAILASIALEVPNKLVKPEHISPDAVQAMALEMLYLSYPAIALVESPTADQLQSAHAVSADLLLDRTSPVYRIAMETDPVKKLELLFSYPERDAGTTYTVLTEALKDRASYVASSLAAALLLAYQEGLELDAQCLRIINDVLADSLLKTSVEALNVGIATKDAQTSLWDLYELLDQSDPVKSYAAYIAFSLLGRSNRNQFDSPRTLLTELQNSTSAIEEMISSTYQTLMDSLQSAEVPEEADEGEQEEAWESGIADEIEEDYGIPEEDVEGGEEPEDES